MVSAIPLKRKDVKGDFYSIGRRLGVIDLSYNKGLRKYPAWNDGMRLNRYPSRQSSSA